MSPKFELQDVKRLVHEFIAGDHDKVFFSLPRRSTSSVIQVFGSAEFSQQHAEQLILRGILKLEVTDFHKRIWMDKWQEIMDEYGLEHYEGHNWYLKFCISDDGDGRFLNEVSFHPLEEDMRLPDGRVLDVTYNQKVR